MNSPDSIFIRTVPDKPKHSALGDDLVMTAFLIAVMAWPFLMLMLALPELADWIGKASYFFNLGLLFLCGPLPIIPTAVFLLGMIVSFRRR